MTEHFYAEITSRENSPINYEGQDPDPDQDPDV
jgi:hypothetical protein